MKKNTKISCKMNESWIKRKKQGTKLAEERMKYEIKNEGKKFKFMKERRKN